MEDKFPTEDVELTHLLVISNMENSKSFYKDILGAEIFREYEGSCVLKFQGNWILLVTKGGPTKDKPNVNFSPPSNPNNVSHEFTMRVLDCNKAYEILKSKGAEFLTPPVDWGAEIRCFFRDPDGNLFEISEAVKK